MGNFYVEIVRISLNFNIIFLKKNNQRNFAVTNHAKNLFLKCSISQIIYFYIYYQILMLLTKLARLRPFCYNNLVKLCFGLTQAYF